MAGTDERHLRRPLAAGTDERHVRRPLAAGRIISVGVTCALVAVFLNASAMKRSAEAAPFGTRRDITVAVLRPIAWVSHALRVDKPREWLDRALDRTPPRPAGGFVAPPTTSPPTTKPLATRPPATTRPLPPITGTITPSVGSSTTTRPQVTPTITATATPATTPRVPTATTSTTTTSTVPSGVTPTTTAAPATAAPTTAAPPPPTAPPGTAPPRVASAEAPLRLIVAGDSLAEGLGVQTENLGIDSGVVSTQRSTQISTGLARSDVYDWPTELQRIANLNPEVVVVLFGGNDHQPMALPDGSVRNVGSPEWNAEYRRRASIVLEILAKPGRTIVWVGQPGMRDGSYNEIMQLINGLVTEEVKARKDTVFVDTVRLLGGGYVPFIAGSDGAQIKIREGDGVHPTATGYRIMARAVLDVIKQRGHLP